VLKAEILPALTYASYAMGWRYAPKLLAGVEHAANRVRDRRLDARRVCGMLAGTPIVVRVVGWDTAACADVVDRVFRACNDARVVREPSLRTSELTPSLRGADVTFVEIPEFRSEPFVDGGFWLMPKRVSHVELLARSDPPLVRRVRRAMNERELHATFTRDPRALAAFVRDIYRPFVQARHGARARPTPTSVLALVLARGALLEVRERGAIVAGAIVADSLLDDDGVDIVVIGARDPADEIARTAPVVFAREAARGRGKLRCDHLGSAPFLRDGVFRRKQRYGTMACDMSHRQDRFVVHVGATPAARAFLTAEPFLVLHDGALVDVRTRAGGCG
jgi:hypothetical protein